MITHTKPYPVTYNNKFSLNKLVVVLMMITAVFGYVISYGKLYAFHLVIAVYWGLVFTAVISIRKQTVKAMRVPIVFLVFMFISLLWAPNIKNGLTFIFYFLCGYTIIFALVNYVTDVVKLDLIFKILAIFFMSNFFVGLLETTGYFRLPVSPYYGLPLTQPSGFNSNLNNFGFVFLAVFPFFFLYPKRSIKIFGIVLALWFNLKLESKGFFLGLVAFFGFYFFSQIKKKSTWRWVSIGLICSGSLVLLLTFSSTEINFNNRAFTAFSQVERATNLVKSGDIAVKDSTGVRAAMYLLGVQELIKTNGMGVGAAGIGSKLASGTDFFDEDKEIFSFHNFFLEMLVDMGVIPFFVVMFAYIKLALSNIQAANSVRNTKLVFFGRASGLAMLTIIPASISPSSIIYVFTFWLVIGFAIATHLVIKHQIKYAN